MNSPAADWSDARLVEHCLDGDERAWGVLVERYKNLVYSIPLKYGAPHQDAADIFQSVWLDLFHGLARLRDAASADTDEGELEELPESGRMQSDMLAEVEREQVVREAMQELPPRCREMIQLLFFEQPPLRYAEVARRLGLAPGSIGFIRGRCLKRLKHILEERGL